MEALKTVLISSLIVFFIIIIITNQNLRDKIINIANKKIFKTRILVKNILAIASILVVLVLSINILRRSGRTLDFLIEREKILNEINNEID